MNKEQYLPRELGLCKGKSVQPRTAANESSLIPLNGVSRVRSPPPLFILRHRSPYVIPFTRSSKLIQSYGGRGQVSDVLRDAQDGRGGDRLGDRGDLHLQARRARNSDRHGVGRGGDHFGLRHV